MEVESANRPRSRQTSTTTTNSTAYSGNSDPWSMNRRGPSWGSSSRTTSATSIWSDEGTTIAPGRQGALANWDEKEGDGERPLIELESNAGEVGVESVDLGGSMLGLAHSEEHEHEEEERMNMMTPAEKLKALLREMNSEVQDTRSSSPIKRSRQLPAVTTAGSSKRDLLDDASSIAGSDNAERTVGDGLGSSIGSARRSAWRDRRIGSGEFRATGSGSVDGDQRPSSEAGPSSPRHHFSAISPRKSTQDRSREREAVEEQEDEEEDSPPTPPPRITNPYLYNRKPMRRSPTPPVGSGSPREEVTRRVPTRVEVLNASASRSPPIPSSPPEPSALRSFIASTTAPTYRTEPLRSSISSEGSRKGKERAFSNDTSIHASPHRSPNGPIRQRTPSASSSYSNGHGAHTPPSKTPRAGPTRSIHAGKTPRRYSIEIPPEDPDDFAAALEGLEVPGEVELDIDEGMSSRLEVWNALESESEAEADADVESNFVQPELPPQRLGSGRHTRQFSRDTIDSTDSNRQKNQTLQAPLPHPTHRRGPSEESLPALPEPDPSDSEDSKIHTLSSRRASLFRSTSKSPRASLSPEHTPQGPRPASQSPFKISPQRPVPSLSSPPTHQSSPPPLLSQSQNLHSSIRSSPSSSRYRTSPARLEVPQEESLELPEGEDESWRDAASSFARPASTSRLDSSTSARHTPMRQTPNNTTLSGQPTPHPPGWFSGTPRPGLKFSPLRKHDGDWSFSMSRESSGEEAAPSIHRLKVSPIKHRHGLSPLRDSNKPTVPVEKDAHLEEVGNESFTARLSSIGKSMIRPISIPGRSKTLSKATPSLHDAARRSEDAARHLEDSQTAFLAALSSFASPGVGVQGIAKASWKWTSWAYWIALELLLCWAVFRVTLDYAASIYPHDPWSIYTATSRAGVAVPLPSALSGFLVPRRGSANFFDLLENLDVWGRLEQVGLVASPGREDGWVGSGVRMLGGVPT